MSSAIEAATFAWRLTVEGAESVAKAFGAVGKSANENLKGASKNTDLTTQSLRALTKQLEGVSKQTVAIDNLKRRLVELAALGGAVTLVKNSLAAAAGVQKLADDTGFAVTSVQELTYALKLFHVEQETSAQAMQNFSAATSAFVTQNAGPAKQAFETLFGADAQAIAQQGLANVDQFFVQVLDRLGKLKSQAQKIELAKELFGRPGAGLVGAADAGREAIEALRLEAQQLGIVFTEDMVEKASEAEDKMRVLAEVLKTKLYMAIIDGADGISKFADIVTEKIPMVTGLFGALGTTIGGVRDFIASLYINAHNFFMLAGQVYDRGREAFAGKDVRWDLSDAQDPFMPFGDPFTSTGGLGMGAHIPAVVGSKNAPPPRGDNAATAAAKAQAETYDKLTFSLKEQLKAVGETDRQQFISNELRKLGAKATQEQRDEIASLAGMLYDERQAWSTMENAATSAFSVITDGLEAAITNAEDFDDVLKNVLKSLAQVAYKALIGDPVSQGFSNLLSGGGGLGGIFSGFFGGGGSGISLGGGLTGSFAGDGMSFIPKFDIGTDYVQRTGLAMIHEGESIVPAKANRGYSGGKSNVFNVDMRGASVEAVERLERMVKEVNGSIENRALMAFQQAGIRSLGF